MNKTFLLLAVFLVLVFSEGSRAAAPSAERLVQDLMAAAPGRFEMPSGDLPDWQDLREAAFGWQPTSSTQRETWIRQEIMCEDSVRRPFHYRLPANYRNDGPSPLLMYLHGGVSREELPDSGADSDFPEGYMTQWATDQGYITVVPSAQLGAVWWDAVGSHYLLAILRQLKSWHNVDDQRVFVTGFSDGASGSWFLAQFYATDFASFVPQAGHPGCDNWGVPPRQGYFRNLRNRPIYAINNGQDGLYPAEKIRQMLLPAIGAGADLRFTIYPDYPHRPDFWEDEQGRMGPFLQRTRRDPHPSRITLEAADPVHCDWLAITAIDTLQRFPGTVEDLNSRTISDRVIVGFRPDMEYEGKACRVQSVGEDEDYPAFRIGLQADDLIIGLGEARIRSYADFREAIADYACGDPFELLVERGTEKVLLKDNFNPPVYGWLHDHSRASVLVEAHALGNNIYLNASRAAVVEIGVDPVLFDLSQPLSVFLANHLIYEAAITPDAALMLEQLDRDRDPERMVVQRIRLDLGDLWTW